MGFLRKLFGGGGASQQQAMTFYVRPKRCDEIVVVRLNLMNDLSLTEDNAGYFVRKIVRAYRCPFEAELLVNFDKDRRVTELTVENGETVEEAVYQQWLAEKESAANQN